MSGVKLGDALAKLRMLSPPVPTSEPVGGDTPAGANPSICGGSANLYPLYPLSPLKM